MENDFAVSSSGISRKIKELLENTDLLLVVSTTIFPAHKAILATFSDYLLTLFDKTGGTFTIILEGVVPQDVEHLLTYIYEGTLEVPKEDIPGLIRATQQLKISSSRLKKLAAGVGGASERESLAALQQENEEITVPQDEIDIEKEKTQRGLQKQVHLDLLAIEEAPLPSSESPSSSAGHIFVFQPLGKKPQKSCVEGHVSKPVKIAKCSTSPPKIIPNHNANATCTTSNQRGTQKKVRHPTPTPLPHQPPSPPPPSMREKADKEETLKAEAVVHPPTPRPGTTPDREQRRKFLPKKDKVFRKNWRPIVCSTMLKSLPQPPVPNPFEEMKNNEHVIPTPEPKQEILTDSSIRKFESSESHCPFSFSSSVEASSDPAIVNKKMSPGTFVKPRPKKKPKKVVVPAYTGFRVADLVNKKGFKKEFKSPKPKSAIPKAKTDLRPPAIKTYKNKKKAKKPTELRDQEQEELELEASAAFQSGKVLKLGETDFLEPSQPGGHTADDDSFPSGNPWEGRKKVPIGKRRRVPASNRVSSDSTVSFFDPNVKRRFPTKNKKQ